MLIQLIFKINIEFKKNKYFFYFSDKNRINFYFKMSARRNISSPPVLLKPLK